MALINTGNVLTMNKHVGNNACKHVYEYHEVNAVLTMFTLIHLDTLHNTFIFKFHLGPYFTWDSVRTVSNRVAVHFPDVTSAAMTQLHYRN
jgi:hypothetical protein